MQLWPPDIDALRAEARQAVADGLGPLQAILGEAGPPPNDPLERARQQRARFAKVFVTVPEAADVTLAGVRCRVVRPDGRPEAVYLDFHGGGMIIGAPELNDLANRELARRHRLAVVSVDYRLGPEHPYPAGPDDGLAVAAWLIDHAEAEFGTPRLLVGGESAGAYMAAVVLLRVRDQLDAVGRFEAAKLAFGVYDWGLSPSQRGIRPHDGPDLLSPEGIRFFTSCYLPGLSADERRDPAISPAFADLRGLPPTFMSVGTTDHLLDDTLVLASRWAAANQNVTLFVAPDMPHGFMAFPCAITSRWAKEAQAWLNDRVGSAR